MAALPSNGAMATASGEESEVLPKIHDALNLIYSPHSSNQSRREAQEFLEGIKSLDQSPSVGFNLAQVKGKEPIIRHYGLSLLEHAIKHKWGDYSGEQLEYLRSWVLQLAENVSRDDPLYIRNKVAQLWVEIAKRCWGPEWTEMDNLLMAMWNIPGPTAHKELVLFILESLSDEIFGVSGDDPTVAMREATLSKICVDIFTPLSVLSEQFPSRSSFSNIRAGEDGWIIRVSRLLGDCLAGDVQNNDDIRTCAIKSLSVLHSVIPWAIPQALANSGCVGLMCNGLAASHVALQKAALEALHALYGRNNFVDDDFVNLVVPMYDPKFVELGRRLFEWSSAIDPEDIDDDKYQFAKKFSEMVSSLGNYLDRRMECLPSDIELQGFFDFLLLILQSQSLVVSIPVLVTWTRLLHNPDFGASIGETALVGHLLEVCSSRLVQYEHLPEDTRDATYTFLMEDTDTIPERHAFLGNYRRYCSQVIESIVQLKLVDALQHILGQADEVLDRLYNGKAPLNPSSYNKNSMEALTVDARFTVIESALKGYVKWRQSMDFSIPENLQRKTSLEESFEGWCNRLLKREFEDPMIRKRILQLLVAFSTTALDRNSEFMLKVLEHILVTWPNPQPEYRLFNESVKDLQSESMVELQRLASKMPDKLLEVYSHIEAKVKEMISSGTLDEKRQLAYQSFLFIIIHRASKIDQESRIMRLQPFINPVLSQWSNPALGQALSSYSNFCESMALDKAQRYLASKEVHKIADWGAVPLDAEGLALQAELEERQTMLPLRPTKTFLTYSVEKLDKGSAPYEASCKLWQDGFPIILPHLLQMLRHAHACHNHNNWANLPQEMKSIVGRVLADRFWQAGISEGSKDEFYARVVDKKGTLEGLASTVRGAVRVVRDTCYAILFCMSRLDLQFYGFDELPGPLSLALFADSVCLSSHQIINLLNLVRYLVDHCPVQLREHFLPPLLAACFQQIDNKINTEWEKLGFQSEVQAAGEALTEEMKNESILRQLTYTAVVMVADFLDPHRTNSDAYGAPLANPNQYPALRKFCLMHSVIVEPLLLFCAHGIRMRDTRCCGVVLRVFRYIIPEFSVSPDRGTQESNNDGKTPAAPTRGLVPDDFPIPQETARAIREFISSEVLIACITSMHEPYFVDLQRELAMLIATILAHYCPLTSTPRGILLSLPGLKESDVDHAIRYIARSGSNVRQQRGMVLDLFKDLKGVSVSEQGKLQRADRGNDSKKSGRSKMAQEFMTAPAQGPMEGRTKTPDLEGVANLFDRQ
ncbi:hypothetical protein MCOR07_003075 [Pyricularia oryzae]|nr:hypothetical protein MCOR07_003075 [Pyricularia oryzae]